MRISDWSSDVCSSDLGIERDRGLPLAPGNTRSIGRQEFIERVWAWREQSGGIILKQLRRLGASCDWSRERFTMDAGLSEAVLKVFVTLYREKLIYRDKRLVNWDPRFHTAISDLERSEEHPSELKSLMRITYADSCWKTQ